MIDLGTVRPGTTLYIPFDSFAAATGAPGATTNFAVGDILIFKDGSDVERASTTGFTATASFNSVTGLNIIVIDLSSDATGDFFKSGSRYMVGVSPITIDAQTVAFWAATFDIGYPNAVLNTSIATLASQTSFTLTAGPAEDDALNGMWAIVHDKLSAVQLTWVQILDYTGSTKTVTLAATPAATFTIAAIDNFCVMGVMPMQPTVTGRQPVVDTAGLIDANAVKLGPSGSGTAQTARDIGTSVLLSSGTGTGQLKLASGYVAMTWADVAAPTTVMDLSNTTIKTTQQIGSVSGAVGSVTGAVGSVTGNVGGNVVGSVGSVVGAVGSVTGAVGSVTGAVGSVAGNVDGNVTGSIGSLAAQAKTDVNGEVVDGLNVDTYAQPGQGTPAATATIRVMLAYLYKAWRNKTTQTATEYDLFNDDAATVDQKATFSDDATTATRGEVATGP